MLERPNSIDCGRVLIPTSSPSSPSAQLSYVTQRRPLSRRVKAPSESLAHDLFHRNPTLLSPNSLDPRSPMAEDEATTPEEEDGLPRCESTKSLGQFRLAEKDRFRSASLEWTLSNGSVTPRLPHYNTHPPLDFKNLKKKLEELTGNPEDSLRRSSTLGQERRRGALPAALSMVPFVTPPPTEACSPESGAVAKCLGVHEKTGEKWSGEHSATFQWKDVAHRVAEKDEKLRHILERHTKELENLQKKHELQWEELNRRSLTSGPSPRNDRTQNDEPTHSASQANPRLTSLGDSNRNRSQNLNPETAYARQNVPTPESNQPPRSRNDTVIITYTNEDQVDSPAIRNQFGASLDNQRSSSVQPVAPVQEGASRLVSTNAYGASPVLNLQQNFPPNLNCQFVQQQPYVRLNSPTVGDSGILTQPVPMLGNAQVPLCRPTLDELALQCLTASGQNQNLKILYDSIRQSPYQVGNTVEKSPQVPSPDVMRMLSILAAHQQLQQSRQLSQAQYLPYYQFCGGAPMFYPPPTNQPYPPMGYPYPGYHPTMLFPIYENQTNFT